MELCRIAPNCTLPIYRFAVREDATLEKSPDDLFYLKFSGDVVSAVRRQHCTRAVQPPNGGELTEINFFTVLGSEDKCIRFNNEHSGQVTICIDVSYTADVNKKPGQVGSVRRYHSRPNLYAWIRTDRVDPKPGFETKIAVFEGYSDYVDGPFVRFWQIPIVTCTTAAGDDYAPPTVYCIRQSFLTIDQIAAIFAMKRGEYVRVTVPATEFWCLYDELSPPRNISVDKNPEVLECAISGSNDIFSQLSRLDDAIQSVEPTRDGQTRDIVLGYQDQFENCVLTLEL